MKQAIKIWFAHYRVARRYCSVTNSLQIATLFTIEFQRAEKLIKKAKAKA
jgi:hypothetical protein